MAKRARTENQRSLLKERIDGLVGLLEGKKTIQQLAENLAARSSHTAKAKWLSSLYSWSKGASAPNDGTIEELLDFESDRQLALGRSFDRQRRKLEWAEIRSLPKMPSVPSGHLATILQRFSGQLDLSNSTSTAIWIRW